MKKFEDWKVIRENVTFNPNIDGEPLNPKTIAGAEVQIRTLARNIRTSFGLDKSFGNNHQSIHKAAELIDQAANIIGNDMDGDLRNQSHGY